MLVNIILIVLGVILVLWGADRLTDGAVALAERMNVSQIVIGLTVVALGTSAPEFCVSLVSALKGTPDLAVGNVVGSNIFNTMLIVGVAALVAPMAVLSSTVRKDIPVSVIASLVLILLVVFDGDISRLDAVILFAGFLVFMWITLRGAQGSHVDEPSEPKNYTPLKAVLFMLLGLVCLVIGSDIFVDGAAAVADALGVSEAVVGLTIVAGGTSLPELATSVVAARKGSSGIAIGNVIGSNVMNILLVLGGAGLICPMTVVGITWIDYSVMLVSVLLLWIFSYTKFKVERWEGAVLTLLFSVYMGWLILG